MDKKFQVFISSTFRDLQEERQAVLRAILELDHMPAGMELFPAADDTAWELIKDVIESSDYYALIVGGRYGSLDEAGIGYTEKEYDYATSLKKPVIPLLHKEPDNLPRDKTETDGALWEKLKAFRAKVEKRHTCVYWTTADDLRAQVIIGVTSAIKRTPAVGWVRASEVPTEATLQEALALRKKVAELEAQIEATKTAPPPEAHTLMQGEDQFEIGCTFTATQQKSPYSSSGYKGTFHLSWNDIFAAVAPSMINESRQWNLRWAIQKFFEKRAKEQFEKNSKLTDATLKEFKFEDDVFDTCIVQFRALGLIKENKKARSVKDTDTYWTLTPYGDYLMVNLRALRREQPEEKEEPTEFSEDLDNETPEA